MSLRKPAAIASALLLSSAVARADVEINNKPTANMSCDAGVCTAPWSSTARLTLDAQQSVTVKNS